MLLLLSSAAAASARLQRFGCEQQRVGRSLQSARGYERDDLLSESAAIMPVATRELQVVEILRVGAHNGLVKSS